MPNLTPDFDPAESDLHTLLGEPSATCPPLPLLLAAREQALPPEANATILNHLEHCSLCTGLLQDMQTIPEPPLSSSQLASIGSKLPSSSPGTTTLGSRPLWPAFAAVAALLLVSVIAFRFLHHPSAEVAHNTQALPPVQTAQIDIPLLPLPPPADDATALLPRGQHTGVNPSTDELAPAFTAYNRGDYALAATRFTALARAYPHSDLVSLYGGVSQLFLHQPLAATSTLQVARLSQTFSIADSAQWYSAIAANQEHSDAAATLLGSLCKNPKSQYSSQSCSILAKK